MIEVRRGAHAGCDATGMPALHCAAQESAPYSSRGWARPQNPPAPVASVESCRGQARSTAWHIIV
jgi:hypothetical protein